MVISSSTSITTTTDWRKGFAPQSQAGNFQEQFQAAQVGPGSSARSAEPSAPMSVAPVSTEERYAGANIEYNGQKVSFDQLPAKVQQQLREQDERRAADEAYRTRVANDPNIGAAAKTRPYDPATDEVAMMGLATMDPSTAHMTPEQYYNYMGSDRAKYDTILRAADAGPVLSPMAEAERRIFGPNLELESKAEMVRDFGSAGTTLPDTFAEFERAWQADVARQAALQEERRKLLDL